MAEQIDEQKVYAEAKEFGYRAGIPIFAAQIVTRKFAQLEATIASLESRIRELESAQRIAAVPTITQQCHETRPAPTRGERRV